MGRKVYRVWICVEEEDVEEQSYEDLDLDGGPVLTTEDKDEAFNLANYIQSQYN